MLFRELTSAKRYVTTHEQKSFATHKYGAATPQIFESHVALKAEGGLDYALKMPSTSLAQMIFIVYY